MMLRTTLLAIGMLVVMLPGQQPVESPPRFHSDEAPVCDPGGPYGCYPMRAIEFDGRGSYDPDGLIVSYIWDFGDGQTGMGAVVMHQYQSLGTYTVSLLVFDNDGFSSMCQAAVLIHAPCPLENCPPICDAAGPYYGTTQVPILFDGSGSIGPILCIPIVYYEWDFGDGTTGLGQRPSHSYSKPGYFIVSLTVTDADGAASVCGTEAVITDPSAIDPATWGRIKHRGGM
jgi:hypothetical protein